MFYDSQAAEIDVSITGAILIFSQQTICSWHEHVCVKQISGI